MVINYRSVWGQPLKNMVLIRLILHQLLNLTVRCNISWRTTKLNVKQSFWVFNSKWNHFLFKQFQCHETWDWQLVLLWKSLCIPRPTPSSGSPFNRIAFCNVSPTTTTTGKEIPQPSKKNPAGQGAFNARDLALVSQETDQATKFSSLCCDVDNRGGGGGDAKCNKLCDFPHSSSSAHYCWLGDAGFPHFYVREVERRVAWVSRRRGPARSLMFIPIDLCDCFTQALPFISYREVSSPRICTNQPSAAFFRFLPSPGHCIAALPTDRCQWSHGRQR